MKIFAIKLAAGVLCGLALAGAGASAAPAVEGGTVTNQPWVVSVDTGSSLCTGVAISDYWVVTAQHCGLAANGSIRYPTGSNGGYGGKERVDRVVNSPAGDVTLAHLAAGHHLGVYPAVDLGYIPRPGDTATIYGAGTPNLGQQRSLAATIAGSGPQQYGGPSIEVRSSNGGTHGGDSGGPVLVGGKVVGVLSASDGGSGSWYAQLSGPSNKSIIAGNTIGGITYSGGSARVTVGTTLFRSNTRLIAFVNSQYAGEVYAGTAYYSSWSNNGETVTWNVPARLGDRIQIGEVSGSPGQSFSLAGARIQTTTVAGAIDGIALTGTGVEVSLPNSYVSSANRVMFWVNGAYVGEVYKGTGYYLSRRASGDDTVFTFGAKAGDSVQISVNPGTPGDTPRQDQAFTITSFVR